MALMKPGPRGFCLGGGSTVHTTVLHLFGRAGICTVLNCESAQTSMHSGPILFNAHLRFYTHTHTHTHVYVYTRICVCVCIFKRTNKGGRNIHQLPPVHGPGQGADSRAAGRTLLFSGFLCLGQGVFSWCAARIF